MATGRTGVQISAQLTVFFDFANLRGCLPSSRNFLSSQYKRLFNRIATKKRRSSSENGSRKFRHLSQCQLIIMYAVIEKINRRDHSSAIHIKKDYLYLMAKFPTHGSTCRKQLLKSFPNLQCHFFVMYIINFVLCITI